MPLEEALFNMKIVCEKTGLTEHVIRIWERRYQAIVPTRTEGRHRLYSYNDIAKLELLKELTDSGYAIRHIAKRSVPELSELLIDKQSKNSSSQKIQNLEIEKFFLGSIQALKDLNAALFDELLEKAYHSMNEKEFLFDYVYPLLIKIGDAWADQTIRVSGEHLGSSIIRKRLLMMLGQQESNYRFVFTTLPDEDHDLGALMAAIYAKFLGHNVLFLGANLPLEDIAHALNRSNSAEAVILSVVYIKDKVKFTTSLAKLKKLVKDDKRIILGASFNLSEHETIIKATDSLICSNIRAIEKLL